MCLICINNYTIVILITGVLSLSAWVKYLYRILQTHHARAHTRTRARIHLHTRAHTPPSPPHRHNRLSLFGGALPTVMARSACDNVGRWPFKSTHELATRFTRGFGSFSRVKKLLGRTETRTRDRMYCQMIRIVRDISRDDRAKISTCSLLTLTDRLKENYSIDVRHVNLIYCCVRTVGGRIIRICVRNNYYLLPVFRAPILVEDSDSV